MRAELVLETSVSLPFKHLTWLVGQQCVIPKFLMHVLCIQHNLQALLISFFF